MSISNMICRRRRWLTVLSFVICLLFLPASRPAHAEILVDDFDADAALDYATHLSETIGERIVASSGERRSVAWLAAVLLDLGYEVEVQPFRFSHRGVEQIGMNVVAVKQGLPDHGTIYVGAHHDTALEPFNGPGANDNASGIGVMLAAAEVLAGEEMTSTVKFIAFGAEELRMVGSGRYVRGLSWGDKTTAIGMLNLDCVGIGEELRLIIKKSDHLDFARSLSVEADYIGKSRWGASDHEPFAAAGIPAVFFNMREIGGSACGPNYHSMDDTADTLQVEALQRVGTNLIIALRNLDEQSESRPIWKVYLPVAAT